MAPSPGSALARLLVVVDLVGTLFVGKHAFRIYMELN
jgi:hypothetical protein